MAGKIWHLVGDSGSVTFDEFAFDSIVNFTIQKTGNVTDVASDGIGTIQGQMVTSRKWIITLTTLNPEQMNQFEAGDNGTLICRGIQHDKGSSYTANTYTATSVETATVIDVNGDTVFEGLSAGTITFQLGISTGAAQAFAYS